MANNDLGSQLSQLTDMKNILSELPAMFEKLGTSIGGQSDPLRELAGAMEEATNTDGIKDMDAALADLASGLEDTTGAFGKFGKAAAAGTAVIAGATGAFRGFTSGLSGTFSVISSLISSVFNLGSAIVGGLMGSWEALVGLSYDLRDAGDSVAKEFEKLKNDFGSLANNEGKAVVEAFKEIRSAAGFAAQTGMSLRFVFGGEFTAGLEQIAEVARGMGNSFGQLKDQFVQNATALVVMSKGLDITGEALANLALTARAAGETMSEALTETMQQITFLEKQFGIDGRLIGKNFDAMAKDVIKFGHMTREELTATAAFATKLGISIESLGGVFDKFENFEGAAEGAAKMAEAFGMNVDAMALMNAESPAEQIDMMRQAFLETGKSLDDLSRSEKAYLEELTGLKGNELYKAFDPANADIGFDDMLDAAEEAAEQVSPEEAMLNAAEKIEKAFDRLTEKSSGFFDAFAKGFMKGATHAAMMNNPIAKLTDSLDKVYLIGYNLAQQLFSGEEGVFGEKSQKFLNDFNAVLDRVVGFFTTLSSEIKVLAETGDFGQFITNMKNEIKSFFESDEVQNFGSTLLDSLNDGLEYVLSRIPGILDGITDALFGEDNVTDIEIFPEGKIKDSLRRLGQTIKDNAGPIKDSLMNLLTQAAEAFMEWAKNNKDIMAGIAAVLFGPAVIKGVLFGAFAAMGSLLSTYIISTVLPGLWTSITGWFAGAGTAGLATSIGAALSSAWLTVSTYAGYYAIVAGEAILSAITGFFSSAAVVVTAKAIAIGALIYGGIVGAFQTITRFFNRWGDDTKGIFEKVIGTIVDIFMLPARAVINVVNLITKYFFDMDIVKPFDESVDMIIDKLTGLATSGFDLAAKVGKAIVDGLMGFVGTIGDEVGAVATEAYEAFKGAFGISSPSKRMEEAGQNMVEGLTNTLDFTSTFSNAASAAMSAAQTLLDPTALIDTVGEMLPGVSSVIENAKGMVESGVSSVAEGISSVTGKLAELAPIAADAMVTKVANGLAADGSVAVQHEGLNIQVNFKVNIDSKDLAAALGDDAEGGPFFVINTDRSGGGTEAAESAGE